MPPRWGYVGLLVHWLIEPMNPIHIVLRWSVEIGYIALLYTCRPAGASAQKRGKRETQAVPYNLLVIATPLGFLLVYWFISLLVHWEGESYTLRSAGARGLESRHSIDISLRWSESIHVAPLGLCSSLVMDIGQAQDLPLH